MKPVSAPAHPAHRFLPARRFRVDSSADAAAVVAEILRRGITGVRQPILKRILKLEKPKS